MRTKPSTVSGQLLTLLSGALVCKIVIVVFMNYWDYLPPNFESVFLRGRDGYFWQGYHWPFYVHIFSGPLSLILGMNLMSDQFRARFPRRHRCVGRFQALCVLLLVLPSGFWMAFYAEAGPVATASFVVLSFVTGLCIVLGWREAVRRRFATHRLWMIRSFVLLCSAVVIRISGGLGTMLESEFKWYNQVSSWTCWVVPLLAFEMYLLYSKRIAAVHVAGPILGKR